MSTRRFRPKTSEACAGQMLEQDRECLALFRRLIIENHALIAQSRALIDWSRGAIAMLERLRGPLLYN
jgi:hypothetical protein